MPYASILFGVLLSALGGWAYVDSGMASKTALIPAIPGVVLVVCGLLALDEKKLKHAMHAAALFGLLAFIAGAVFLGMQLSNGASLSDRKALVGAGMGGLGLVFTALCVNSFIQVRRAKARAAGKPAAA